MTSNVPSENQKRWVSRTPRQPSITPAQRAKRDREEVAREVEALRAHQRALRAQMYDRLGKCPPGEQAA